MQPHQRNKIYNVGLGRLPGKVMQQIVGKTFDLNYSSHARGEGQKDGATRDKLPVQLTVVEDQVVEIETFKGVLVKFLVRVPLNETHALCLVVVPEGNVGGVLTVYLNAIEDKHNTLNRYRIITQ